MKIPYLNTRSQADLLWTFLLTPFWWFLGFGVFIYQWVAYWTAFKLWVEVIRGLKPLRLPKPAVWLGIFLVSYLISILINAPNHGAQRVLASINNLLLFLMGFCLLLAVYDCPAESFLKNLCRASRFLCLITGVIALIFLGIWGWGDKSTQWPSVLSRLMPSLGEFPFFYNILTLRITAVDWLFENTPRISIYSAVNTATGGFTLMILPLSMAYSRLSRQAGWLNGISLALGLITLAASVSRTAICAFLGAICFVWFLEKRERMFLAFFLFLGAIFGSGILLDLIQWLFHVRSSSTVGRLDLYYDAIQVALEQNWLFGIGVRLREGFTAMSIGSHSTYVGLFLMTGALGLGFFILFQLAVGRGWFQILRLEKSPEQKVLWRYLGISFVAMNTWILTDGVDGLPFIAFTYFLITSAVVLLGRWVTERESL